MNLYPTPEHQRAAEAIVEFFTTIPDIESVCLICSCARGKASKAKWLPYYDEALRHDRLSMVRKYCLNNLDHIPLYVERGLHFQCPNRFYDAFREFLQALFIARRTYPIAYDKWIQEQIVEILGLPKLYERLPRLFEIHNFESHEILDKANTLRSLLDKYAPISV